ncbi:protein of unknown function [Pseudonocardia thermophila]|uniref:DUF4333 domain-containing protein n=1 Tax=Pseudonocardia thermophila TaxID=1848 RepID=A0A1M6N789_PSETH|nr:DUF4333 domain-containing protein [Pseudonocardia thermophila]SHJ91557.1 protein of unknown function [Pseudonocardia thermophila]
MSTPQGSGSNPTPGDAAEQPTEQASWGQAPPGGWGQQAGAAPAASPATPSSLPPPAAAAAQPGDADPDRTQRVDPAVWSQQLAAAKQAAPQNPAQDPAQGPAQSGAQPQQPSQPVPGAPAGYPPPQQWGQPAAPQSGQPPAWGAPQPGQPQQQWGAPQTGYGGGAQQHGGQPNPYAPPAAPPGWGQQAAGQQAPVQPQVPGQAQWGAPPQQQLQQQPQPGQPGQQWGAQQWGQQPGFGGGPAAGAPKKKSRLGLILGAVVLPLVVVGVAAVLLFVWPGFLLPKVFDEKAVQEGVTRVLTTDYGLQNVTGVSCPPGREVKAGTTFVCEATIDGDRSRIEITVKDDQGTYEVGRPSSS